MLNAAWWYKPEYVINELNINSVITTPGHEEILAIKSWTSGTPYTLRGYAYSGEPLVSFMILVFWSTDLCCGVGISDGSDDKTY